MDADPTVDLEAPPAPRTRQRLVALTAAVLFAGLVVGVGVVAMGGKTSPLPKLPLSSTGSQSSEGSSGAALPAFYPYGSVQYRVQGTLPALTARAVAYRLPAAPDLRAATRLAAALGLHGSGTSNGPDFSLTSGGHSLTIFEGPGLTWSYGGAVTAVGGGVSVGSAGSSEAVSPPAVTAPAICPHPPPCPPNALCPQVCVPTTVPPPADLPSAARAEQIARQMASAAGFAVADADITVTESTYSVSVELAPRLDGLATSGFSWVFDLGSKGVVQDARGYLASPQKLGSYPLAGTAVGLTRLQKGMGVGPEPMMGAAGAAIAYPVCSPRTHCPVQTVTITGVHLAVADEGGYLVPVYVFTDATGTAGVVPATTDAYLETPSTSPIPIPTPTTTAIAPKGSLPPLYGPTGLPTKVNPGGPVVTPTANSPATAPCGSQPPPGSAAPDLCRS